MSTLQILSYEPCGKTALCAGIGKKLAGAGKKIAYIRPINITDHRPSDECSDATFINEALELGENKEQMCPIKVSQEELWRNLSEDFDNFAGKIKAACEKAAGGADVLIIESPGSLKNDKVSALASYTINEKIDTRVILLVCFSSDFKEAGILQAAAKLGEKLVGVVLNQVPESRLSKVQGECTEYFKSKGINVLGVLPESRALLGVSVARIAEAVGGVIISSKDKANDLVENIMLGAMTPDLVREYYAGKKNKAVITRTERPDMQLAALDTSTKCLIVSGTKPHATVMVKAEDKKVPVMVVDRDIPDIVSGIEKAIADARFQSAGKLQAMTALLDSRFDYKTLNAALGLK
ncbi:MAG: DRTGG domain-containing protein [Dehalococcoidia bacterium]